MTGTRENDEHKNTDWYIKVKSAMDDADEMHRNRGDISAQFPDCPPEILDKVFAPESPEPTPDK